VPYFSQLLWVGYANYLFIRISKYKPNLPHSDVQVARNVFRLVPVNNERPVSFYRAVGRLFWELGDMTSAREVLNKAVNCQPSNEMTYLWLGQITLSLGYFEEALNAFYQARGGVIYIVIFTLLRYPELF
jgi:tetratricopeptide (TPR) repeat protein